MAAVLLYVIFVVVGVRYLEPAALGALLTFFAAIWLLLSVRREGWREGVVPTTALAVGAAVWLLESTAALQLLPVMVSLLFFVKFLDAAWRGRPFLAEMLRGVPRLRLSEAKYDFIDRSHGYWAAVTGLNTLIQAGMVAAPMGVWALYTTAGWYLLFAAALTAQIVYGRLHGV